MPVTLAEADQRTIDELSAFCGAQPDAFVMEGELHGSHVTDEALILFEVLSKSNTKADQAWRRRVYASVPNGQHPMPIATATAEITRDDRTGGWSATKIAGQDAEMTRAASNVSRPLRQNNRWTPIVSVTTLHTHATGRRAP